METSQLQEIKINLQEVEDNLTEEQAKSLVVHLSDKFKLNLFEIAVLVKIKNGNAN